MFQTGDFVVYGNSGVCRVQKIGTLDSPIASKEREYYTLAPYYIKGSTIFTPVDNQKIIMRPVLTKEEAIALIDEITKIDSLWIADEKTRELQYKETFRKCDCRELVKIIKTIYRRKKIRLAEGKKVTTQDEKYFHMAEEALYGELAISLGMTKDEVKAFVIERAEQQDEAQEGQHV